MLLLVLILMLLWKEEKTFRKKTTHGLASKYWALRERRRYVRFKDEIKIRYNLLPNPHNPSISKTADISKKGLCLVTYEKLKKKSYLNLELDVPGSSKPLKLLGRIMWLKELKNHDAAGRRLFYIGIQYFKIKPESEAMLLMHLATLKQPNP